MKYFKAFPFLLLVMFMSCNRDSNELAPSKFEDEEKISKVLMLNGVAALKITFIRKSDRWRGSSDMLIENLTHQNITKLGIYVQVCDTEINYDKCNRITPYVLSEGDTIKAGNAKSIRLSDDYFFNRNQFISVYLMSLNARTATPTSSAFYPATTAIIRNTLNTTIVPGTAKTYVELDGSANIYVSSFDGQATNYYNINGTISPAGEFGGFMEVNANPVKIGVKGMVTGGSAITLLLSAQDAALYHISSIDFQLR